jgi:hypothetical protein
MTTASRAPSPARVAMRVGGSIAILGVLLAFLPVQTLFAALANVPLHVWPLALGAYLCLHLVGTVKWRLMVNAAGAGLGFCTAIRCYYAGLFGNLFLPSIVGGDLVRAGLAMRLSGNKGAVILGSLVDRALDMLALGLTAGVGALLLPQHLDLQSRKVFLWLALAFALAGVIVATAAWLLPARRFSFRVRRHLVKVRLVIGALTRSPGRVLRALALGMVLQGLLTVLNAWLGRQVGIDIPFAIWLFAWPLAKISGIVPVSQGGIGVREAAQVALLVPFGVPAVAAMAAALVFEAVIISGGLLGGLGSLLIGRRTNGMLPAATRGDAVRRSPLAPDSRGRAR